MMQPDPPFDAAAALEQIDGDHDLFAKLVGLFVSQSAADMAGIREAVRQRDSQVVMQLAHRLKGSALQFHASALQKAARDLESAARGGVMTEAVHLTEEVEARLADLTQALQRHLHST
jgi:HPt (histidine-containing phosphotransfer) domain-containing protein